jgi:hypothetical protein
MIKKDVLQVSNEIATNTVIKHNTLKNLLCYFLTLTLTINSI